MKDFLKDYKAKIDFWISEYLEDYFDNSPLSLAQKDFKEAILYSVKWGKRIRAILALEVFLSGKNINIDDLSLSDNIVKFAISLELIHAYSLVHDDLPCMDNDVLRRGEPTCWKKYGEYTWVLVWDTLNTLAFEVLSEIKNSKIALELISLLSKSSWTYWMIWWQVEDIYFEKNFKHPSLEELKSLHNKKTWALIMASIKWWAVISGIELINIPDLTNYSEMLWLAFQIKDDILDVEWTVEETWKSIWWENKWYVYHFWLEKAKETLLELTEKCHLKISFLNSEKLNFLTDYIAQRKK